MRFSFFTILMLLGLFIPSTIQAQYCSSRGYNASPRYIQEVEFGENIHVTGNNGGYLDFTSPKFIVLPGRCAGILSEERKRVQQESEQAERIEPHFGGSTDRRTIRHQVPRLGQLV